MRHAATRLLLSCALAAAAAAAPPPAPPKPPAPPPSPPALPRGVGGTSCLGCFVGDAGSSRAIDAHGFAALQLPSDAPAALSAAFAAFAACGAYAARDGGIADGGSPLVAHLVDATSIKDCAARIGRFEGDCYVDAATVAAHPIFTDLFPLDGPLSLCRSPGPMLLSLVHVAGRTRCLAAQLTRAKMDTAHPPAFGDSSFHVAPGGAADGSCAPTGGTCTELDAAAAAAAAAGNGTGVAQDRLVPLAMHLMWHPPPSEVDIDAHFVA